MGFNWAAGRLKTQNREALQALRSNLKTQNSKLKTLVQAKHLGRSFVMKLNNCHPNASPLALLTPVQTLASVGGSFKRLASREI
ncbi:MAG: hypothetical protein ACHBN1_38430 [Heteroscytonema crispum UTEX LB 1556]